MRNPFARAETVIVYRAAYRALGQHSRDLTAEIARLLRVEKGLRAELVALKQTRNAFSAAPTYEGKVYCAYCIQQTGEIVMHKQYGEHTADRILFDRMPKRYGGRFA